MATKLFDSQGAEPMGYIDPLLQLSPTEKALSTLGEFVRPLAAQYMVSAGKTPGLDPSVYFNQNYDPGQLTAHTLDILRALFLGQIGAGKGSTNTEQTDTAKMLKEVGGTQ